MIEVLIAFKEKIDNTLLDELEISVTHSFSITPTVAALTTHDQIKELRDLGINVFLDGSSPGL